MRTVPWLFAALAVAGCGATGPERIGGPPASADAATPPRYQAYAFVLEARGGEPMLCVGAIAASLPPICGDVPISNWSWDAVEGEERFGGAVWGEYHVVGRYDGKTFTVEEAEAARPPPSAEEPEDFAPPCPVPGGGWDAADASPVSQRAFDAALARAERAPDSAGAWIAYIRPSVRARRGSGRRSCQLHPRRDLHQRARAARGRAP